MLLKRFLRLPILAVIAVTAVAIACGGSSGEATTAPGDAPPTQPDATSGATATQSPTNQPGSTTDEASDSANQGGGVLSPVVDPDPDYEAKLRSASFRTGGWETDFSRFTVDFDEILSGGVGRDGIPPIDNPKFVTIEEADEWLEDVQPIVAVEINGEAKAYPLQILTWHEIVNDTLGGSPLAVTFCPLCNTAIAFDRNLGGQLFDFGVSGNLRNSDLIMWDRQTQTWWQQLTGKGIIGELAGHQLEFIPAPIISWADFKEAHPESVVLSRDTGFNRPYGSNPYSGYDRIDQPPFLFDGETDGRLLPKERVAAVEIGEETAAFPFPLLETEGVVNYMVGGTDLVVFFKPGTVSALDRALIVDSNDVGSTGVFDAALDGQKLSFQSRDGAFVDNETGSVWNILGKAVSGPMAGKSLTPIVHGNHFWFAWGAFNPDTKIYQGQG